MAKLRSTERPIIEFELSSSTPEDPKRVKAYGRLEMEDLAAMKGSDAVYQLVARLLIVWSWEDEAGPAEITVANLKLLDPEDFIEIVDELGVDAFLDRMESSSKKKSSSATSSPKPERAKAKR